MATTNFINNETLIVADWANDIDRLNYDILGNPADITELKDTILTPTVRSTSSSFTVEPSDDLIFMTASSSERQVRIPGSENTAGRTLYVKFVTGSGTVVIDPQDASTIDGSSDYTISTAGDAVTLVSDGSDWQVVATYSQSAGGGGGDYSYGTATYDTGVITVNHRYAELAAPLGVGAEITITGVTTTLDVFTIIYTGNTDQIVFASESAFETPEAGIRLEGPYYTATFVNNGSGTYICVGGDYTVL